MKSYTDLEQSRKLAEILPLESADMCYILHASSDNLDWRFDNDIPPMILGEISINELTVKALPCWSLAALLSVLRGTNISTSDPLNKIRFSCWNYYDITYASNPIDACYEMILKFHELNLL